MTPWLLIPVKTFEAGKSRLRTVLPDDSRRALNEFLLRRMLAIAKRFSSAARTMVVSDCDQVLQAAATFKVQTLRQKSGRGLNRAATEGVADLRRRGASDVLLVPCDLPRLRVCDLADVTAVARKSNAVIICPDKHGTGTNAILLPADAQVRFRFGRGSLLEHCSEASRARLPFVVHFNPRVAFDVDTPHDLAVWLDVDGTARKLRSEVDLQKRAFRLNEFDRAISEKISSAIS